MPAQMCLLMTPYCKLFFPQNFYFVTFVTWSLILAFGKTKDPFDNYLISCFMFLNITMITLSSSYIALSPNF